MLGIGATPEFFAERIAMNANVFLAVDMGASGGRVLAGRLDDARLSLEELHRFENGAIRAGGHLYWDVLGLWSHVCQGLRLAAATCGKSVRSIGVDTWGVDFALLGHDDALLGNPFSYRDARTDGMMDLAIHRLGRENIFSQTGLQFMPFNTLYQLLAMKEQRSPLLAAARSFLMMPDVFHWLLTGVKSNEVTNATTTQFYNPLKQTWATELLQALDLPTQMLGELVEPGTCLGPLRADVAAETSLVGVDVVAPGTHDTASAVMAVPAASGPGGRPDWCYISSGTWSLMGVELPRPVVSENCRQLNFTNEGGVEGSTRLLKNITGLWLVQECRRVWSQAGHEHSWESLTRMADGSPPLASLIDPDHASFQAPGDMPEAIRAYCRRTGQPVPGDEGAVVRCAIESLALKCRHVLGATEALVGGRLETIHIVGGGTKNRQLCQATADACRRRVLAGPVEATAIGNVMTQAIAAGAVGSVAEAREVIRRSFPLEEYLPRNGDAWGDAYERFASLLAGAADA